MYERLVRHWVYGGFLAALLLLMLLPLLTRGWDTALLLVFLHLPVYMIHQYEEHDDDRFRTYFNQVIGGGKEVLSPHAVFVINVPGVWGVIAVSVYLASEVDLGFGLIAVYLAVVNALVHIAPAVRLRGYNPGLATALTLFLPLGGYTIAAIHDAGAGGWFAHGLGLGLAIAIHGAIIAYVRSKGAFGRG